jgi:hypothetical protein
MEVEFNHLSHATWECKYLPATPRAEAGDTEGRGQSPCPLDSGDPRQSGARRAQAHPRACVRG